MDRNCWQLLDATERSRASALKQPAMKTRYVEVHGIVRRILALYLETAPDRIVFGYGAHGKPYLNDPSEWVFNLSHSGDRFALAVAKNCRLGVDIELCKARTGLASLVEKCFADEEIRQWQALAETEKTHGFYRMWTRKEAFVKAVGRGIALGLERCVVNPVKSDAMLRVPEGCEPAHVWRLADIDLGNDVACAVANDAGIAQVTVKAAGEGTER